MSIELSTYVPCIGKQMPKLAIFPVTKGFIAADSTTSGGLEMQQVSAQFTLSSYAGTGSGGTDYINIGYQRIPIDDPEPDAQDIYNDFINGILQSDSALTSFVISAFDEAFSTSLSADYTKQNVPISSFINTKMPSGTMWQLFKANSQNSKGGTFGFVNDDDTISSHFSSLSGKAVVMNYLSGFYTKTFSKSYDHEDGTYKYYEKRYRDNWTVKQDGMNTLKLNNINMSQMAYNQLVTTAGFEGKPLYYSAKGDRAGANDIGISLIRGIGYDDKDEINSIALSSAMDIFTQQYNPVSALLNERWDDDSSDAQKIEKIFDMAKWENDYRKSSTKHFIGSNASRAQAYPSYFDPKQVLKDLNKGVLNVSPSPAMFSQYYAWKTTDIEDSLTKIYASFGVSIYCSTLHYSTPNFNSMWIISIDPVTNEKKIVIGFWISREYEWYYDNDKTAYISGKFDF